MIYAPLSQNIVVKISALFPQMFWDWKADLANFSLLECVVHMIASYCAGSPVPKIRSRKPEELLYKYKTLPRRLPGLLKQPI